MSNEFEIDVFAENFLGTIVGNILVCIAVCLVRKLRKPSNYLLVSLAVSDLCVAVLVMPMAAVYELSGAWPLGRILCDMWVALDVLACAASILNLCMISVDRYFAITKPLEYGVKRTPKRMLVYIAVVWLGAAAISIPPPVILGNEHGTAERNECVVCQNFWYQILATLGSFYIPLIVMMVVYSRIFKAAKRITNEEKRSQIYMKDRKSLADSSAHPLHHQHQQQLITPARNGSVRRASLCVVHSDSEEESRRCSDSSGKLFGVGTKTFMPVLHSGGSAGATNKVKLFLSSERKASATLGIIMSAFVICWLPFFVLAVVRPFAPEDAIPHALTSFFLWLGYANSFLNPVIYATLNKDFRTPFREILCFRCRSLQCHKNLQKKSDLAAEGLTAAFTAAIWLQRRLLMSHHSAVKVVVNENDGIAMEEEDLEAILGITPAVDEPAFGCEGGCQ
ncbi:unnamed protein product [Notodromas monacha]|uniref:G-protein coupled receptors family 1 profile domain-containing protein n=1 Tax=Notodromas monacha TaxID=399045 RepID=A0A7R9BME2_9CRUS|nr:unnamed protein product [Notodromas monacha]CAG0917881.1 unnamed protein product [Notodromas monacha]